MSAEHQNKAVLKQFRMYLCMIKAMINTKKITYTPLFTKILLPLQLD